VSTFLPSNPLRLSPGLSPWRIQAYCLPSARGVTAQVKVYVVMCTHILKIICYVGMCQDLDQSGYHSAFYKPVFDLPRPHDKLHM
jgi:hypothetical protein